MKPTVLLFAVLTSVFALNADEAAERPNILWLVIDDMGLELSCYGEHVIETPNIDRLARDGTRFTNAFLTSPVCSTARSSMITGMYQTTIGAHNHQSGRGKHKIHLPGEVIPIPELFQKAEYYTANGDYPKKKEGLGKNDYNFEWDEAIYDGPYHRGRNEGQPFFAQLQLWGGKNRHSATWATGDSKRYLGSVVDPETVNLPPYYPRDPLILEDWAQYLDTVRYTDQLVGQILDQLETEGILDETIIILFGDNGISHARGKQFVYDEGIRTPLIIRGPGIEKGEVRDDLVEHIDLAATSLALAGESVPGWMQGDDILARDYRPKEAVFAARDRCGETVDMTRSVHTGKYKYIRNFFPDRPHLQPTNYKDTKPILIRLRELQAAGKLSALQEKLLFSPYRALEELYDIETDPYETVNLGDDSKYRNELKSMRERLKVWMKETKDLGPESAEEYAAEMEYQIGKNRRNPQAHAAVKKNVEMYRRWATERPYVHLVE
jgi:arylsulfatase A-like enzyme|tara:strand:- start:1015 stop:2496 length:1482 start_codon:yes stop_codon:yes gene_type:complete